MFVLVDIEIDGRVGTDQRPAVGSIASVELRDTSEADGPAVVLARNEIVVTGTGSRWLATTELISDEPIDSRADLNIWVRIVADESDGDWITMQSVPVDPVANEQRVAAPVRPIK